MEEKTVIIDPNDKRLIAFQRMLNIMDDLRENCPWDMKQTLESLRHLTIEETYELSDAILKKDLESIKGELGDIFLHLIFYARIASETGDFDFTDVLHAIAEKLVYRHPHIYGDTTVSSEEDVKANWEKLKLKEGRKSVLEGVPESLPALVKAIRIQDKVKGVGFDWETTEQVREKVEEELAELDEALAAGNAAASEEEFGDLLFSLVNYARFLKINPEDALEKTNRKFRARFTLMESLIAAENASLSEMKLEEMDIYWEKAKAALRVQK